MSELARINPVPMPKYLVTWENEEYAKDLGPLAPGDVGINILKVVQRMSPQARTMPLGSYVLSVSGQVVPNGTVFVPLFRKSTFIKWTGKPGEGTMDFRTDNPDDPRIKDIDGLAFRKDPETGKPIPPPVTQYLNFYVVLSTLPNEPVLLSFYRTFTPAGRKLTQAIVRGLQRPTIPMFSLMFKLNPAKERKDENFELCFDAYGWTPESSLRHFAGLRKTAMDMDNYFERTVAQMETEDPGSEEPKKEQIQKPNGDFEAPQAPLTETPPKTNPPPQAAVQPDVDLWGSSLNASETPAGTTRAEADDIPF